MEKAWIQLEQIDEQIEVNRRVHDRIKDEIHFLEVRLENVDNEYKDLNSQKLYLAKKAYGDPEIRKGLIKRGKQCSNSTVRKAAAKLQEKNTDIKWDDDVKMELIDACIVLDRGDRKKLKNSNFIEFLAKVGKLGYVRTSNY